MKKWILLLMTVAATHAQARDYKYSDLIIKDYDEMNAQVQEHIKKAHAITKDGDDTSGERDAIEELRDALKLIFSRPNSDNMVAKLTPDVRRELGSFSAFEDTLSSIVAEEVGISKDASKTVSQRSTALFVLENILSEVRPEVGSNPEIKRLFQRVAEAKLKVDEDVVRDRKLRSMFKTRNPSEMAREILKGLTKADKAKGKGK